MITVTQVTDPSYTLGEGPWWDATRGRVLWVDIAEGLVLAGRLEGERLQVETTHRFPSYAGVAVAAEDGSLLVAETRSLTRIAPDGTRTDGGPVDVLGPDDRFNDGICDARGRFLVGTCSISGAHHSQHLLRIDRGTTTVLDDDLGLSNGLAFSPDGGTLYSVDSEPGRVWRRDYDQETGATGERTLLLDLPDCTPDGMTVDAEGLLWLAIWGGGQVRCYTPSGELVDTIAVPAPHTTSVAFVGADLDRMLISTAREDLTDEQLAQSPLSGSLFRATPGTRGLPAYPWSGHLTR